MITEVSSKLAAIAHELALVRDSYNGYIGCRKEYKPEDLDHIILDLMDLKNLWKDELKK